MKDVLNRFARALMVEAHVITRRPNSLWSQLYSRLQWEEDSVVAALQVSTQHPSGGHPWLRVRVPYDESNELLMTLQAHVGSVKKCVFSPDDGLIVSTSEDKTLRIWDAKYGKEIAGLPHEDHLLSAFWFSPDGSRLVLTDKNVLNVWDLKSTRIVTTLTGHTGDAAACVWREDGQQILSSGADKTLRLWDASSGQQIQVFETRQTISRCWISANGSRVVGQIFSDELHFWDTVTANKIATVSEIGTINGCAYRSDSNRLVVATSEWILEFDVMTGKRISGCRVKTSQSAHEWSGAVVSPKGDRVIYLREGKVREVGTAKVVAQFQPLKKGSCVFTPDGGRFATFKDSTVLLFDTETGRKVGTLEGHSKPVTCIALNTNGARVVSGSEDQTLKVWSADVSKRGRRRPAHDGEVGVCVFSPDGKKIVTFGGRGDLKIWDSVSGDLVTAIVGEHAFNYEHTLHFSPDSSTILGVTDRTSMAIWDALTGEERARFSKQDGPVVACKFTRNGERVISAGDSVLRIWETSTSQLLKTLGGHSDWTAGFCTTSDGRWLVSTSADRTARIWDLTSNKEARRLQGHTSEVLACALSPDEKLVVSASKDGSARIWEFDSGREVQTLRGHEGSVAAAVFTTDGNRIVSQGVDSTLRVWDVSSGKQLATLVGAGGVACFSVSPDGRRITSLKRAKHDEPDVLDAPLVVWDAETGNEITSITLPNPVVCSAYHPTEERLVCGDYKGGIHLVDVMTPGVR